MSAGASVERDDKLHLLACEAYSRTNPIPARKAARAAMDARVSEMEAAAFERGAATREPTARDALVAIQAHPSLNVVWENRSETSGTTRLVTLVADEVLRRLEMDGESEGGAAQGGGESEGEGDG